LKKQFIAFAALIFIFLIIGTVSSVSASDTLQPKVKNINPTYNSVNVPTYHSLTIKFTKPVKAGTNYLTLKNSKGTSVQFKKIINGNTLTIKPTSNLSRGVKYVLILHAGCVKDLSGNKIAPFTSCFKTDSTGPKLKSIDPAKNAFNVNLNKIICLKFNEAIKFGNKQIELVKSNGLHVSFSKMIKGNSLFIKPQSLSRGTKYFLTIHKNSLKDLSGNGVHSYSSFFVTSSGLNTNHPLSRVKICFIHHSSGGNWLSNGNGNLGTALNRNNYYVTETDYGWNAEDGDNLGDRTDTVNWPEWFNDRKMSHVYQNNYHSAYINTIGNLGGENEIIMFKSCFPNSEVGSSINDEKAIYNSLKTYFAAHPNKLFVLITPPGETHVSSYKLTKDLCNWLVDKNGWLKGYTGKNVLVYDFYGTLSETNSHHRYYNGVIQHVYASDYDGTSPYHNGDDHPNALGNQKATNEFITLLNIAYNRWKNL
jgi:methionine-rich copper-binding protein CopC